MAFTEFNWCFQDGGPKRNHNGSDLKITAPVSRVVPSPLCYARIASPKWRKQATLLLLEETELVAPDNEFTSSEDFLAKIDAGKLDDDLTPEIGDESSILGQDRIRPSYACDIFERFPPEAFSNLGQRDPFWVGQPQPRSKLGSQDPVLRRQILVPQQ
jgi:hypothetical protein